MQHLSENIISINLPASKSICNRVLILKHLSKKEFSIQNLSDANDSILLQKCLNVIKNRTDNIIDCEDAGTVFRFLTSVLSTTPGNWLLTGTERMQERPIGQLVDSLKSLGADIKCKNNIGFPPIEIIGKDITGNEISLSSIKSSQFISSLMMVAPFLQNGLKINIDLTQTGSLPYIIMTAKIMQHFGLQVEIDKYSITVQKSILNPIDFRIENDWSSASYFYECVALQPNFKLKLPGLFHSSIQGDSIVAEWFKELGVNTIFHDDYIIISHSEEKTAYFEKDFNDCPDLAPTFAVCCAALKIPATLTGLSSLKIKECDRLEALSIELSKMNVKIETENDILKILPSEIQIKETVETYEDHRIAMAFAPLKLFLKNIVINNENAVKKSFPGFWKEFSKIAI